MLRLTGIAALLLAPDAAPNEDVYGIHGSGLSNQTTTLLQSACSYQAKASDTRLAKPSTSKGGGEALGLNKFKNIQKAQAVKAERIAKKEEAKLIDTGIRVAATLWSTDGKRFSQITPIRITQVFGPEILVKAALDRLLSLVQGEFVRQYPEAKKLTWYIVLWISKLL